MTAVAEVLSRASGINIDVAFIKAGAIVGGLCLISALLYASYGTDLSFAFF